MQSPAQSKIIRGKRYFRGVWDTTRTNALRKCRDWRSVGYNATAVKQDNGMYAVYMRKPQ